jgi:hypothetical protein
MKVGETRDERRETRDVSHAARHVAVPATAQRARRDASTLFPPEKRYPRRRRVFMLVPQTHEAALREPERGDAHDEQAEEVHV